MATAKKKTAKKPKKQPKPKSKSKPAKKPKSKPKKKTKRRASPLDSPELRAAISERAADATERLMLAALAFHRRQWDDDARDPVTPARYDVAPVTFVVPASWRQIAFEPEPLRVEWNLF